MITADGPDSEAASRGRAGTPPWSGSGRAVGRVARRLDPGVLRYTVSTLGIALAVVLFLTRS